MAAVADSFRYRPWTTAYVAAANALVDPARSNTAV
jgi:hypothetical protein